MRDNFPELVISWNLKHHNVDGKKMNYTKTKNQKTHNALTLTCVYGTHPTNNDVNFD